MEEIVIDELCSEWFVKISLFSGNLPPVIGASIFSDWDVEEEIFDALHDIFNTVMKMVVGLP